MLVALGHILIEGPLILLIAAGLGGQLESTAVRSGIGLAGGAVLVWMGSQLLRSLRSGATDPETSADRHPVWTGVVLTAANPYFLVWWATVGLALTSQALQYGRVALIVFALAHWLCDVGWLAVLSWAGFKGIELFGSRLQTAISAACGAVLLGFGFKFVLEGALDLVWLSGSGL